jgi:hypothetical protein
MLSKVSGGGRGWGGGGGGGGGGSGEGQPWVLVVLCVVYFAWRIARVVGRRRSREKRQVGIGRRIAVAALDLLIGLLLFLGLGMALS